MDNVADKDEARVVMFREEVARSIEEQAAFLGVSPDEYLDMAVGLLSSVLEPIVLMEQKLVERHNDIEVWMNKLIELGDRLKEELDG